MSSNIMTKAYGQLSQSSNFFADLLDHELSEWEGEILDHVFMGSVASAVLERANQLSPSELQRLFDTFEKLLVEGNQEVSNVVATGFMEALMAHAVDNSHTFDRIKSYLGPQSSEYCYGWDPATFGEKRNLLDKRF